MKQNVRVTSAPARRLYWRCLIWRKLTAARLCVLSFFEVSTFPSKEVREWARTGMLLRFGSFSTAARVLTARKATSSHRSNDCGAKAAISAEYKRKAEQCILDPQKNAMKFMSKIVERNTERKVPNGRGERLKAQ